MSRYRDVKRICSDRRKKEKMFLGIMVIPLSIVFLAMTMTACNRNVGMEDAELYVDAGNSIEYNNGDMNTSDLNDTDNVSKINGLDESVVETVPTIKSEVEIKEEVVSLSKSVENTFPDSFRLEEYDWLNQYPELPTGCEITSLTSVLNYYGFDVDKTAMADNYLAKGYGSFYKMFLGNPRDETSFGCMAQPIVDAANKYFKSNNTSMKAENISGSDFEDILKKVAQGDPVVIWNTMDMRPAFESQTLLLDGEEYIWIAPEHCVVITGYDINKRIVYIMDPTAGNVTRNLDTFKQRYEAMHSQAMYIAE